MNHHGFVREIEMDNNGPAPSQPPIAEASSQIEEIEITTDVTSTPKPFLAEVTEDDSNAPQSVGNQASTWMKSLLMVITCCVLHKPDFKNCITSTEWVKYLLMFGTKTKQIDLTYFPYFREDNTPKDCASPSLYLQCCWFSLL